MKFLVFLLLPFFAFASLEKPEIIVNNRILATVNGKSISVMDVMKKMEVFLSQHFPDRLETVEKKYQFFSQSWRQALNELVKNELILADAEKLQLNIPDAKIREIIHERFGPNVMETLDGMGLTFDEAWQMTYTEVAVQQVSYYRVYKKSQDKIGPQDIKVAYQNHLKTNPPKEEWKYRVLSIRAKTEQLGDIYAQKAAALLRNEPLPFETLAAKLKESENSDEGISVTVSDEYQVDSKDLSEAHRSVLCTLASGEYSEPVSQVSRSDNSTVHRIFYLKELAKEPPPSFDSMVENLFDDLVQKEIDKDLPPYLAKLRKQFNFNESAMSPIPSDFQPFLQR